MFLGHALVTLTKRACAIYHISRATPTTHRECIHLAKLFTEIYLLLVLSNEELKIPKSPPTKKTTQVLPLCFAAVRYYSTVETKTHSSLSIYMYTFVMIRCTRNAVATYGTRSV